MGKVHSKAVPKSSTWRTAKKLELLYIDVCGAIQTSSLGENVRFESTHIHLINEEYKNF